MLQGNYDLYEFSKEPSDGLEWRNNKAQDFSLWANNESGYLYANSADQTLTFTGLTGPTTSEWYSSVIVDGDITPFTNGWRIFANTSVSNAYVDYGTSDDEQNFTPVDCNFYKMNATGDGFDLYKDYVVVAPGEAVFVETSASGKIHWKYEPQSENAPVAEEGTYHMPWLPLHGLTTHQDASLQYLRGDINNDGKINVTDIVYLISYLKNSTKLPGFNMEAADADGSGTVDDADIEALKEMIMSYP